VIGILQADFLSGVPDPLIVTEVISLSLPGGTFISNNRPEQLRRSIDDTLIPVSLSDHKYPRPVSQDATQLCPHQLLIDVSLEALPNVVSQIDGHTLANLVSQRIFVGLRSSRTKRIQTVYSDIRLIKSIGNS
jgi:hypothetical protein